MKLTLSRDKNGNKIVKVKPRGRRAFSIQTNGNLPAIHAMEEVDIYKAVKELIKFIRRYGTDLQKSLFEGLREEIESEYEDRKCRSSHPDGEFDKAGRFYPSEQETCDCCAGIRSPSRAYPYSYMVHCRSKLHVTSLITKNF